MQENIPYLPVGYRFRPTDSQLLGFFLYNHLTNIPIPYLNYSIPDCDLYGYQEPWEIWNIFKKDGFEDLYFFTKLKKKSSKGSRFLRKVGKGTWQGQDGGTEIVDREFNRKLGLKKSFRYENKDSDEDGCWLMQEYTLESSLLPPQHPNDYVLCRIRRNEPCLKKKRKKDSGAHQGFQNPKKKSRKTDSEAQQGFRNTLVDEETGAVLPCPNKKSRKTDSEAQQGFHNTQIEEDSVAVLSCPKQSIKTDSEVQQGFQNTPVEEESQVVLPCPKEKGEETQFEARQQLVFAPTLETQGQETEKSLLDLPMSMPIHQTGLDNYFEEVECEEPQQLVFVLDDDIEMINRLLTDEEMVMMMKQLGEDGDFLNQCLYCDCEAENQQLYY